MKELEYPDDCRRIQRVCISHGYYIGPIGAEEIWHEYSDSMCAGWIMLPLSDEILWRVIEDYLIVYLNKNREA